MKKALSITYNTFALILLNIVFFICNYYPKHILEFNSWHSLLVSFLNLLFYVLFFSLIIIFFKKEKTVFSKELFNPFIPFKEKFELNSLFVLLFAQIITDLLNFFSSLYLTKYAYFVSSFLTLINWLIIYLISTHKKHSIFISKKYFAITTVICLILFAISFLYDFKIFTIYTESTQKYVIESTILKNTITNLDFFLNLKNFIFDTLIGIVFIVLHFVSLKNVAIEETDEILLNRKISVFIIRIAFLMLISFILIRVRVLITPYSSLSETNLFDDTSTHYVHDNSFYASSYSFTLTRRNGYNTEDKVIFQNTKIKIYCNQAELYEISTDGFYRVNNYSISGNQMTIANKLDKHVINGQTVYVLEDLAICYHENNTPRIIKFSDINSRKENPILTDFIKELVCEGNVLLFVNAYDYLKKHDFEFANSTAQRYTTGDFTNNEKTYINKIGYRTEYLQALFSD